MQEMFCLHDQVGHGYLLLAKVLQQEGSSWSLTMSRRAVLRAWQILQTVKQQQQRRQQREDEQQQHKTAVAAPAHDEVRSVKDATWDVAAVVVRRNSTARGIKDCSNNVAAPTCEQQLTS
jgi:hypothetical protein